MTMTSNKYYTTNSCRLEFFEFSKTLANTLRCLKLSNTSKAIFSDVLKMEDNYMKYIDIELHTPAFLVKFV